MALVDYDRLNHPDNEKCSKCRYGEVFGSSGNGWKMYGCGYLNITQQRRPCKGGKDCKAFKPKGEGQQPLKAPVEYF